MQCGGLGSRKSCHHLTGGNWTESLSLSQERVRHNSWKTKDGLYLLGGQDNFETTAKVTDGSDEKTETEGFELEYETE